MNWALSCEEADLGSTLWSQDVFHILQQSLEVKEKGSEVSGERSEKDKYL